MKQTVFVGAIVALLGFGVGCGGDACDDAADKLEECAEDDPNVTVTRDDDAECTAQAECFANCVDEASCDLINSSAEDAIAGTDNAYNTCTAACLN